MIQTLSEQLGVSAGTIYALFALSAVEMALAIWALIDLIRRERVLGDRKWIWALVILLINGIGPIIYLVIGRRVPEAAEDTHRIQADGGDRAQRAVDTLYGSDEGDSAR